MLAVQSLKERINLSRREVVILAIIMIIAIIPRFWNLDSVGLSGDEAVYAGQARVILGDHDMTRFFLLVSRGGTNFMLEQTLEALTYAMTGFSDFSTRLMPSVLSVATVGIAYLLGRELFNDRKVAPIAASLMAINGYAISVGRLGLLDSTMTFFFALSIFFYAKWLNTERSYWLYIFAASAGLAVLTKAPSLLIFPIAAVTTIFTGQTKILWKNRRTVVISFLIFVASLTPAFIQIISDPDTFFSFFSEGNTRVINVPVTYYFDKMVTYNGVLFIAIAVFGIGTSAFFRERGDMLCLTWIAITIIFFQMHPIKGWNYILPLIPPVTILAARASAKAIEILIREMTSGSKKKKSSSELPIRSQGLASSSFSLSLHYDHGHNDKNKNTISLRKVVAGIGAIVLLGAASYLQIQTGISNIINERPFAGLKEAAFWLRDNMRNDHDGVMTISHGSAQYILSLYANLDSYPFGKFRLHTILPGGATVKGAPAPEPLIQDGTVSYLVYYTPSRLASGDDPIHNPGTPNSAKFINLIHKYQSPLRHIVYDEYTGLDGKTVREPRVWIYEVGKRLPSSSVESHIERGSLKVSGAGFLIDSYVNFYYGRNQIETIPTDNNGAFSTSIKVPVCGLQLVVFDEEGNRSPVPMSFCAKR